LIIITEYLNTLLSEGFKKGAFDVRQVSPLLLAYVGDTVCDLYVRTYLLTQEQSNAHRLHMRSIAYVCSRAQSSACFQLLDQFSEEELYIYKRGRNSHPSTIPKNADITEYRTATGLEAVLGYLYLSGQNERLDMLMQRLLNTQAGGNNAQSSTKG